MKWKVIDRRSKKDCKVPLEDIKVGDVFDATIDGCSSVFLKAHRGVVNLKTPAESWVEYNNSCVEVCDYHPVSATLTIEDIDEREGEE